MQKSVISIIKGGLGNQLFIYAASRALAIRLGRSLFLDAVRGYTHDTFSRSYRLNRFPIAAEEMPEAWRIAPELSHPRHKMIRAFNKLLPRNRRRYFAERHHLGASQLTHLRPVAERMTLLGYWQNEAYFSDYADIIGKELSPPEPESADMVERGFRFSDDEYVFVHFRRKDYEYLLDLSYYQNAIDEVCRSLGNPKFALFGDLIEDPAKELDFHGRHVEVVSREGQDEIVDLWLMSHCRHAIIANSSFSWWGAWLLQFRGTVGLVFAPKTMGLPLEPASGWRLLPNRFSKKNQ